MSLMSREATYRESAAYGGLIDAIGGIATIVLTIVGLAGVHVQLMVAIATIVFGVALLIQGGTMVSEFAQIVFPSESKADTVDEFGATSLTAVFMGGAAGIVLGVLALLGINPTVLTPIATIVFGTALVLSSNAVWRLYMLRRSVKSEGQYSGSEILASEIASGSAGMQALAGLTAIVLGVLAVAGEADLTLNLVALLALGSTIVLTGGGLAATVLGFMRSA
ncbi:hypothetical protein WOC76_01575 [Methylocystis sp. IM3]|uniref:hypothetical protein n=1 Tax=unclassified Methylocystis TaxID=2625913 RepID=UPI0030FD1C7F